ncbi:MAG TPA: proton-conducting transporter membrane subunit [Thermoanaerobaculaceae bacterium]|nr:proton-conducting transporter membrane subunit [Thermoanaerobaculaceae bacterium]
MEALVGSLLLTPLLGALLMPWVSKLGRRAADALVTLVMLATLVSVLALLPAADLTTVWQAMGTHFAVDGLSLLFLVVINVVGLCCAVYSIDYIGHYGGRAKFYSLLLLLVMGLNGVVLVRDIFSLYLFLEVASVAAYVLVAYNLEFDGIEAALKYLLLSVVATGMVLIGIALILMTTGTLAFAELKTALAGGAATNPVFMLAAGLFVAGFGLKAAVVPFHAWLPDAHPSAPAPISAMLSGVVIKVAGVYALVRIFFGLYAAPAQVLRVLLLLGIVSMIAGSLIAFFQTDFKRLLAYSSISQIGYILIGLGIGNWLGVAGALFHILNHAIFKSLLFLNSGAVQLRTGTRDIREMGGLENRMRVTGVTSTFGTLSIAGVPPFGGFFSKLFIILGAVMAKQWTVAFLAVFFSIFTLGYFLYLQRRVFFGKLNERWNDIKEAPAAMSIAVVVLAATTLLLGVFFDSVLRGLIEPAARVLLGGN